jgi:hypothetical protein
MTITTDVEDSDGGAQRGHCRGRVAHFLSFASEICVCALDVCVTK